MSATTGWRAANEARRPHTKHLLRKHPPTLSPTKRRRTQAKDRNRAVRLRASQAAEGNGPQPKALRQEANDQL